MGALAPAGEEAKTVCGTHEASCVCLKPHDHEPPHECYSRDCGGAWAYDEAGFLVVVRFPQRPWWWPR